MRKLTESLLRFGWSMSVFGTQQAINLATPRQGWDEGTRQLDAVSRAATHELGETFSSYYRAGESFQSGLVDTAARLLRESWTEPGARMNEVWEGLDRTRTRVVEAFSKTEEES